VSGAPQGTPEVERASAQLFDFEQLADYARFTRGALRRHRLLALGTFLGTVVLSLAAARFLPRTYYTETSILAKLNLAISALVNPERTHVLDPEPPNPMQPTDRLDSRTRAAADEVLQRRNLVAMIKRLNLLDRWKSTRPPLLRIKDKVMDLVRGPLPEHEQIDGMVGLMEKQISVSTDGAKVTFGVTWNDPQLAFDLSEALHRSFFELREREELTHINDAISILERYEARAGEEVEKSLAEFEALFRKINVERRRVVGDPRVLEPETGDELAKLRFQIRAKRRAIDEEQEQHSRRLAAAEVELLEQRSLYAPDHPSVRDAADKLAALRQGSPQLEALRTEEQQLLSDYVRRAGRIVPYPDEPVADPFGLERVLVGIMPNMNEYPKAALALDRLRSNLGTHQSLVKRLEMARMEREVAQVALKYRYTVITPPEFPSRPVKPNAMAIAVGGLAIGMVLALVAALARDFLGGRVLESWQVQRSLGLPVIAQLDPP
jgi:hypothetical protein